MTITADQLSRIEKYYSELVSEPMTAEVIKGTLYVYGSELACLRLHYKMAVGRVNFSKNLNTWYFSKDLAY